MEDTGLLEMFDRMLADLFDSATIRRIEDQSGDPLIWKSLEESGFLDALVEEKDGGSGLSFADTVPLFMAMGRRAVPFPIGETMIARAMLAKDGQDRPDGAIALGLPSLVLPGAQHAEHVLIQEPDGLKLDRLADSRHLSAEFAGPHDMLPSKSPSGGEETATSPMAAAAAVLFAALIAGASDAALQMSTDYALERVQFGKPIAQKQALQQNLAVASEHVVAARMACETAANQDRWPSLTNAACAKITASGTASIVARTAHALHGAIGISAEHDLNLYTRRMQTWRIAGGTESFWAARLGEEIIADPRPSLNLMLEEIFS